MRNRVRLIEGAASDSPPDDSYAPSVNSGEDSLVSESTSRESANQIISQKLSWAQQANAEIK